jgi:general secretion pathway protein D
MASILQPLAGPGAIVRVDPVRNMIVLVGTRNQAEGWLDVVTTFDVDMLKGMSVGIFPLKYVSTTEVEAALRLLNAGSTTAAPAPPPGGPPTGATPNAPASIAMFGAFRILPIARINSVMVVTPRAAYLDEARRWIEKLDQPGGNSAEPQLFVYAVQNGNAKHLADVLNGLFGGAAGASAPPATSGVAPGLRQTSATTTGFSSTGLGLSGGAAGSQAGAASTVQGSGLTSMTLPSGLRVMADEINNAVLVYGTRGEYEKIEMTLKRLDVPPTQVLIEASIIEVTLNDDLKYGLQWAFTDKARHGLNGTGVLSSVANLLGGTVLGGPPAGFSYTLTNSLGDVRAVLNALADKSLVKVISSPSMMVLDNYTASIAVGNQQPVQVGETINIGGNYTTNVQYKDTGVSLTVTPSVNAGNMVTMQLSQAVTDVGPVDTATGQRSFLQRQFASKVAVRSGETLVLGGLIRDNTTTGKNGVPGLIDIPILGNLFGTTATNTNRTELVVLITPRVVRSTQDLREVGQEFKDRMKTLFPTVGLPLPQDEAATQQPSPTKP